MARRRAVVVSQPPGLGGTPVAGHCSRRDHERLLDHLLGDVDVAEETDQGGDDPTGFLPEDPFELVGVESRQRAASSLGLERTDLDRTHAGRRRFGRPLEGGVEVRRLDDPEAAEVLLGLGERTVGHDGVAARGADDGRDLGRFESAAEDPGSGLPRPSG